VDYDEFGLEFKKKITSDLDLDDLERQVELAINAVSKGETIQLVNPEEQKQ